MLSRCFLDWGFRLRTGSDHLLFSPITKKNNKTQKCFFNYINAYLLVSCLFSLCHLSQQRQQLWNYAEMIPRTVDFPVRDTLGVRVVFPTNALLSRIAKEKNVSRLWWARVRSKKETMSHLSRFWQLYENGWKGNQGKYTFVNRRWRQWVNISSEYALSLCQCAQRITSKSSVTIFTIRKIVTMT